MEHMITQLKASNDKSVLICQDELTQWLAGMQGNKSAACADADVAVFLSLREGNGWASGTAGKQHNHARGQGCAHNRCKLLAAHARQPRMRIAAHNSALLKNAHC